MKLEVVVRIDFEIYWVVIIIIICEQLFFFCYDGYGEDWRVDFWCDIRKVDFYFIGWCEQNKKIFEVLEGIRDKVFDWDEFLWQILIGVCSFFVILLEGFCNGRNFLDFIVLGFRLEC